MEATINSGEDKDTIANEADVISINGGTEEDIIKNGYVEGEYKLFVNPFGGYSVVYFSTTEYFKGGNNVTIKGGEDNDNIYNVAADNVTIKGDKGEILRVPILLSMPTVEKEIIYMFQIHSVTL